jgi:hypothetical protein
MIAGESCSESLHALQIQGLPPPPDHAPPTHFDCVSKAIVGLIGSQADAAIRAEDDGESTAEGGRDVPLSAAVAARRAGWQEKLYL